MLLFAHECDERHKIHVYSSPDIKDGKREERGDADTERPFLIGARQKIPSDIKDLLKLSEFKKELLRFIFSEYEDQIYAPLMGGKVFYCSVDNLCKRFCVSDGCLEVTLKLIPG